jgi:hypothetical protein
MIREVITFQRHHKEPMVGRSAGSVPSGSGSSSERSNLGRLMSNRSWIHICSRRGHPRRIPSLLAGLVTAEHIPL